MAETNTFIFQLEKNVFIIKSPTFLQPVNYFQAFPSNSYAQIFLKR